MVLRAFKYMFEFRGRKYEHRRCGELVVEIVRVIKFFPHFTRMRTDRINGLMRKALLVVEETPAVHIHKTDKADPTSL